MMRSGRRFAIIAVGGRVTQLLILNLGLFLPVVVAGLAASWFGWKLAGSDSDAGEGGSKIESGPLTPRWPSPVPPRDAAGPRDLARSA
jgi:hypothetical protein